VGELVSTARSMITPSDRTIVHGGLPVMNGRHWIGSGSLSPIAWTGATVVARFDHVSPLSVERMTWTSALPLTVAPWWSTCECRCMNPSTSVPSGRTMTWLAIV